MEPGSLFERVTSHLDQAAGAVEQRMLQALRTLVWLIAAIAFTLLAVAFSVSALIVALWDTQHLLPLIIPAVSCALLAVLFGFIFARSVRLRQRSTLSVGAGPLPRLPDTTGAARRGHRLGWLMAIVGLLYLGPSREFLALAVRLRGVLALIGHALHLAQLVSRGRSSGARTP
jgi:hypothetical protein